MNLRLDISIYYRTLADEFFVANLIPVGTERPLESGAQRAIESFTANALLTVGGGQFRKRGAGVIVLMPVADVSESNIPGPLLDPFYVPALILENPSLNYGTNGTNKTAEEIMARYLAVHHQFTRQGISSGAINAGRNTIAPLPRDYSERGLVGYTVNLTTRVPIITEDKVAMPVIALSGNTVTITCATSGAQIRYTTNNTDPFSSNTSASLYTAPFQAAPGSTICAAAEKPGLIASDVRCAEVSS